LRHRIQIDPAARRRRTTKRQRRARGRVDLVAVVHLDDLDVVVGIELGRRLLDQRQQEIDPEAHVRRLDNGRVARRAHDRRVVVRAQTRGADDVHRLGLGGQLRVGDAGGGRGEVNHRFRPGEELERIGGHRDAQLADPGQITQILAQLGAVRLFGPAGDLAARGAVNRAQHHAPHAPGAADHADSVGLHALQPPGPVRKPV
jgi:hypothetical protein